MCENIRMYVLTYSETDIHTCTWGYPGERNCDMALTKIPAVTSTDSRMHRKHAAYMVLSIQHHHLQQHEFSSQKNVWRTASKNPPSLCDEGHGGYTAHGVPGNCEPQLPTLGRAKEFFASS